MKLKSYGSIYIGTYEVSLRIYEVHSKSRTLRLLTDLRRPVHIAHDLFNGSTITYDTVDDLIHALKDMKTTLAEFGTDVYEVYGGYAVKAANNYPYLLDQIRQKTGLFVRLLSNSEQRFFSYEALASLDDFPKMIEESALLADVGGSSIQLTLFSGGKIITTQHILLGATEVRENLIALSQKVNGRAEVMDMINKEIETFFHVYLPNADPKYMILLNDNISNLMHFFDVKDVLGVATPREAVVSFLKDIGSDSYFTNAFDRFESDLRDEMALPFLLLYDAFVSQTKCDYISIPGISLHAGMTYDAVYRSNTFTSSHDFSEDVIDAAWAIAKRYGSYDPHVKMMDQMITQLYSAIRKKGGLSQRDLTLARVVAILHDCGKYISLSDAAKCSYAIIMNSEILGLTHKERKIVALAAQYHHIKEIRYDLFTESLSLDEYMKLLKLLAMLRICNALDSSHRQKVSNISFRLKEEELFITVSSESSLNLEKGYFKSKAQFFVEVFGFKPVIREKKNL
ncbi:MAG: HD domain-containing protein [Lachnospiraceae bacterium]|nr:HD domain-containing protein [Lachnospiraceae bacterium]